MTPIANIDFETYSEAGFIWDAARNKWAALPGASQGKKGLPVVGASVYVGHPTFEVLTLSYDLRQGAGVQRWQPGLPPPVDLLAHVASGGLVSGWNAAGFEMKVWRHCVDRYRWPPLPLSQVRDTMAAARAFCLPGALGKAGEVMALSQQKNADGKRLLDKFSIPRNPTQPNPALRIRPADDPADAEKLYAYCDEDVLTEQEAGSLIPPLSPKELAAWQTDRGINDRGVQIDLEGAHNCIAILNQAHRQYNAELRALTGGTVERASELAKLQGWLGAQGVVMGSMDEEAIGSTLAQELPAPARRALEIRQAVGSASVKKVFAMANTVSRDGRLRDLFIYHGARTGRPTGSGPQPTNLPNSAGVFALECEGCDKHYGVSLPSCPWCGASATLAHTVEWGAECAEDALESFKPRSLDWAEYVWGDSMAALSGSLRGLFIAAPGHDLICSDYSSIEAVGLAMLAGEQWRIDLFRSHGKIYEMSASKTTGIPFEEILEHKRKTGQHHQVRKLGKVQELALGYQGWVGSMLAFGADEFMSEAEMKEAILAWRAASPAIVELWGGQERNWQPEYYGVEGAFVQAVLTPGAAYRTHGMDFQMRGDALFLRLLSGRELTYHRPRLAPSTRRPGTCSISYEGWNSNPKNGPQGWQRMETWAGRLVENINQAQCRDIQWHGVQALERAGYPIVLHVYDEDVAEVPEGFGSIEEFERVMGDLPEWCADWPIKAAGGWRGKRYRK
jgi:DNA polymerase